MKRRYHNDAYRDMDINNKTFFITGGTGSFGEAFISYLLSTHSPQKIVIFSRDEKKQLEFRLKYHDDPRLHYIIGDVRDVAGLQPYLRGIDFVFHAAALVDVVGYDKGMKIIGMRHGEKKHEVLISQEEWRRTTDEDDYYRIVPESQEMQHTDYFSKGDPQSVEMPYTSENAARLSRSELRNLLLSLDEIRNLQL
ncbi:polysaccharide biosynthesis protein [Candidatus Uhrbacteria bacterium]|nr:polysaccharide biosynthesis protein [Candidatus Uhrbacteria bacterium]